MSDGLQRIHIVGFGSLADVELRPGRLTVLIGANGSGKSNVLRALKMVSLMRVGSLQRYVAEAGGAAALLHYGPKRTPAIDIELEFVWEQTRRSEYQARLAFAAGDRLAYASESVLLDGALTTGLGAGSWESGLSALAKHNDGPKIANSCIAQLTFYHFHDTSKNSPLRTHARVEDDQSLHSDGGNLAAFLARLEQSSQAPEQAAWHRINQIVRRIAPSIKQLSPTVVHNGSSSVRLDWIDDQDERFGVHQLSDGTLRAIALITALAQPTETLPRVISMDEPELGLHPAAIRLLAELARSVSRHAQVMFATQSTEFLDHFEPDEVVVVEREGGHSVLKRLDTDELAGWLEDYSLAEVFDKGVIGGRP
jgi:predicted ATPase